MTATRSGDFDVRRVLVVGAGAIGMEIAAQCAAHGVVVHVHDVDPRAVDTGPQRLARLFTEMGTRGPVDGSGALALVTFTSDMAAAAAAVDLACECVPEQLPLKRHVLAEFDRLIPAGAVLATTSSYFLPSMLVAGLGRRERFAAFHVHSPVWLATVADIMPHGGTSAGCVALLERFARRIGQIPIVLKREHPGYVFNSMLRVLLMSALTLAERDVASPEDVDRAWMGVTGMPVGPFGMLDRIGLETVRDIARYWGGVMRDPQVVRNGDYLQRLIDAGRTGHRCGRGFYFHPQPAYEKAGFLHGAAAEATARQGPARPAEPADTSGRAPAREHGDGPSMVRCELVAVAVGLPQPVGVVPEGRVILHGDNTLGAALARRLRSRGLAVVEVPTDAAMDRIEPVLVSAADAGPCHLVLAGAWTDASRAFPSSDQWTATGRRAVTQSYAICQAWYRTIMSRSWRRRAAVVGVTTLGGDLGVGGRITEPAGGAITGLLKAVYMESRAAGPEGPAVRIVDCQVGDDADVLADRVCAEFADALALAGASPEDGHAHLEAGYRRGERRAVRLLPRPVPVGGSSVRHGGHWVITGGARGITAEVARRLARTFGLRLIVLGTTAPGDEPWERLDAAALEALKRDVMIRARGEGRKPNEAWDAVVRVIEVRRNLAVLADAGIEASYHVCRLDDAARVAAVLTAARRVGGPIHGVIHGAGFEHTGRFERKTTADLDRTLAGKVDGLIALLEALHDDPLEQVVAFGSLAGRCGGVGQTDYALANDLLAKLVARYRADPRGTAACTIHWPGWADVGMAARPASRRALEGTGHRLLSVEEGCRHAIDEIAAGLPSAEVAIVDPHVLPAAAFTA